MKTLLISLFLLTALTSFGQKSIKESWILKDGNEISYAEYKQLDPTRFSEINVIPGSKKTVGLFGKKSKKGILHLKTSQFIENQKVLFDDLKAEFRDGGQETKMLVINGIPYERNDKLDKIIMNLKADEVEWILVPESQLNQQPAFNNSDKRVKIIQTNVELN
jgi:hypothetical protein